MTNGIAGEELKRYIESIEKLEAEKANIALDIREIFARAKGEGLCPKTMRQILKIRKMDSDEREEQETLVDIYCQALGMLPLFEKR